MLTVLPCGGLGELDPRGDTMRIVCQAHRIWDIDPRTGRCRTELVRGVLEFVFRDTESCGAVTDLDRAGQRVIVAEEAHRDA